MLILLQNEFWRKKMRGCEEFFHEFYFSRLKRVRYNKNGANIEFTPCKFFFSTDKSRLRVIPFIYFISCLFIVYYSIPEVSSIGIQVYWAGIPEVSSARNFRQTGIPEVSSRVKKIEVKQIPLHPYQKTRSHYDRRPAEYYYSLYREYSFLRRV